jgi:ribosomal protein S18 acetylase RimI-like enzyme
MRPDSLNAPDAPRARLETVSLRSYTRDSPLLEDALNVYTRVWPERDPDEARENFVRYAGYGGFRGLVAFAGDVAAGVGYGANSEPGVWWHDQVGPVLGDDHPALHDSWRLVELAVIKEYRRHGVGGQLHDALIASQPCPRVLLCTAVANDRARAIYERRGWYYVHPYFDFPGEPHPYVIMGKELGDG